MFHDIIENVKDDDNKLDKILELIEIISYEYDNIIENTNTNNIINNKNDIPLDNICKNNNDIEYNNGNNNICIDDQTNNFWNCPFISTIDGPCGNKNKLSNGDYCSECGCSRPINIQQTNIQMMNIDLNNNSFTTDITPEHNNINIVLDTDILMQENAELKKKFSM